MRLFNDILDNLYSLCRSISRNNPKSCLQSGYNLIATSNTYM